MFGLSWTVIITIILAVVVVLAVVTKRSDIIIMIVTVGLGLWVLSHVNVCGLPAGVPF